MDLIGAREQAFNKVMLGDTAIFSLQHTMKLLVQAFQDFPKNLEVRFKGEQEDEWEAEENSFKKPKSYIQT